MSDSTPTLAAAGDAHRGPHAPAAAAGRSLLAAGAGLRLAVAAVSVALLWLGVAWAL